MSENLLYANFFLDGRGSVRMLFEIDHLHGNRLARQPIDEELHSGKETARLTSKNMKIRRGFFQLTRHKLPRPTSERGSNSRRILWHSVMPSLVVTVNVSAMKNYSLSPILLMFLGSDCCAVPSIYSCYSQQSSHTFILFYIHLMHSETSTRTRKYLQETDKKLLIHHHHHFSLFPPVVESHFFSFFLAFFSVFSVSYERPRKKTSQT